MPSDRDESDDHDLETDPESWASPDPAENPETIFDPEELEIADNDAVEKRGEGRYVVSTDGTAIDPSVPEEERESADGGGDADHLAALGAELADNSTRHALAVAVRDGDETSTLRAGGEPPDALESVLRRYARTVEPDRPADETLRAILADSTLDLSEE